MYYLVYFFLLLISGYALDLHVPLRFGSGDHDLVGDGFRFILLAVYDESAVDHEGGGIHAGLFLYVKL
jgi:hypothetical protein